MTVVKELKEIIAKMSGKNLNEIKGKTKVNCLNQITSVLSEGEADTSKCNTICKSLRKLKEYITEKENSNHIHNYSVTSTSKATKKDATKHIIPTTYTCSNEDGKCDNPTYTENVEEDHNWVFDPESSDEFVNVYYCTKCNATKEEDK